MGADQQWVVCDVSTGLNALVNVHVEEWGAVRCVHVDMNAMDGMNGWLAALLRLAVRPQGEASSFCCANNMVWPHWLPWSHSP